MTGTATSADLLRKPTWLQKRIRPSAHREMESLLRGNRLHTVCEEAMCPNISECFCAKTATFLIMGKECTRACSFCSVSKGKPSGLDPDEPENVAQAVQTLGLRHVVITSPTRDDLPDGGAEHFSQTVQALKAAVEGITVELLIPDMKGDAAAIRKIAGSGADIIGHNVETVPRLYHVRSGASFERSLAVLKSLADADASVLTKSGIMLGLGETEAEVLEVMRRLIEAECRLLSIGQYLAPSPKHAPVAEYVRPELFEYYRHKGMEMGFRFVKSSPYTRSSYMAHEYVHGGE